MENKLSFSGFGMSEKELQELAKLGIRYDKRSQKAYLSEFTNPSVASEADIVELESKLGAALPKDYHEFLLAHNGGQPNLDKVFVPDHGWTVVQHFSPLVCRIPSLNINELLDTIYKARMPAGYLPIATTPGGDWFLLSLKNDSVGNIYYWDHELEEMHSNEGNYLMVANSFSSFLSNLQENDG